LVLLGRLQMSEKVSILNNTPAPKPSLLNGAIEGLGNKTF
jgi:hypothetical protein